MTWHCYLNYCFFVLFIVIISGCQVLGLFDYFANRTTTEPMNTDEMMQCFLDYFMDQVFTVGQQFVFRFENKPLLLLVVTSIDGKLELSTRLCCIFYLQDWFSKSDTDNEFSSKTSFHWFTYCNTCLKSTCPPSRHLYIDVKGPAAK